MINMLKADVYRLTRSKGTLFFWLIILLTYAISICTKSAGGISLGAPMPDVEGIKMDIQQVSKNFTWYYLFIFPVYTIVAAEFSEKTYKNTITSAISRRAYFLSKYCFTQLYSILSYLVSGIAFYLLNLAINGTDYASSFGEFMKPTLLQLPVLLAVTSLFICLAFLFRKAAVFNAVTIVTPLLYVTLSLILYGIESTREFATDYMLKYEIGGMLSELAAGSSASYRNDCMLISAVVLAVSIAIGYLSFTKMELD